MNKKKRIIIDIFGSDKGPETVINGGCILLEHHPELNITFVGSKQMILSELAKHGFKDDPRINIIHTDSFVNNFDNPGMAIFQKSDASIFLAEQTLAEDEEAIGLLTAGSSGSILMGSFRYLATENLTRPCMASILPSAKVGEFVCLVDTGASVDCLPAQLHEFACLGRDLMRQLYKIESPKIGLLSNGAESSKGNKLVKEVHGILSSDSTLNFVGNIEGNNALSGDCDVLVADGFAGNLVLKVTEGTAARLIKEMVVYSKAHNQPDIMPLVQHLMKVYDISSLGGGIVLGVKKPIIKCRGNSNEMAIFNTGEILINIADNKSFFEGKLID
ncbi:MAG TPA: hypothetical protein PLR04_02435 [Bacilli bacterium]|nr:hypothetical protein [Bacilli bacterium]